MAELIPIFKPGVSEAAIRSLSDTLRAGWLSEGRQVKAFEEAFCREFHLPRALALNSGTAALHLALLAAGIQPGDEIITTPQTFVATALAALYVGAKPVFADIQENTPNLDPQDAARRVGPRTRAILVVHYGGYPCDMDEINELAGRHGLLVIEDAAHALGAEYRGRPVGSLGQASIFSFQAIKQLTTGDGGMLVCNDPLMHRQAYRQRWFGIDREGRRPSELGQPEWDIQEIGYKYHMNEIAATLGLAHLQDFSASLARRRALNQQYRQRLGKMAGLRLLDEKSDRLGGCWLFTFKAERRLDFIRAMKARGVEAAVWHRRIDRNSVFGGLRGDLPRQEAFEASQVSIPLRDSLGDGEAEAILRAVEQGW